MSVPMKAAAMDAGAGWPFAFYWHDWETGERYEVAAWALNPRRGGRPEGTATGPDVRIVRIRDSRGREVAGELFGTFASFAIRDLAQCLLEARRAG